MIDRTPTLDERLDRLDVQLERMATAIVKKCRTHS